MTLAEMAAMSASTDGWQCPQCGCKDWRVVNSHERNGVRKRQRVCRNCEYDLPTIEFPVPQGYRIEIVKDE